MLRGGGGGDGGEPVCGGLVRAIQQARERDLDGSGGASGATGAAAAGSQAGRYVGAVGSGSLSGGAGAGDRNHHGAGAAEYSVRFLALWGGGEIGDFRSAVAKAAEKAHVPVKTHPFLAYPQFLESLSEVAVGLQPIAMESPFSRGKSFGKVLAYLAADVAVVASDALDHPLFFRNGENGMLAKSLEDWIAQTGRLLREPELRQSLADRAWEDFGRELSTEAAARKLAKVLGEIRE